MLSSLNIAGSSTQARRLGRLTLGWRRALLAVAASLAVVRGGAAAPVLPDLIVWARDFVNPVQSYMYDGTFDTATVANQVQYRFNVAIPNVGAGALELREETHPNLVQDVYQRIFDDAGGGVTEHDVGSFPNALPELGHLYLQGLAQYNLREVVEGGGVGPLVTTYDKTSFGVIDSVAFNTSLPGAPPTRVYSNPNHELLGISIGWADVYSRNLRGQRIDITGIPSGQYWLEVVVDPYNRIQETDNTNNTTRILVNLVIPPPQIIPGDYNGDDIVDAADYTVWRETLGQMLAINDAGTGADGNGNAAIDLADFSVWKSNFGKTRDSFGAGAIADPRSAVPEPGTLLLAALALFGAPRARRRKP